MKEWLSGTSAINEKGHLCIGGCDTVTLSEKFGTPLFVYDVALIRKMARGFKEAFEQLGMKHKVAYASKAFTCLAIYQLIEQEGLSCDVVSAGELYTALKAGMAPEKIAFHGNNKTFFELEMAVKEKVGTIIVDNFTEIALLSEILSQTQTTQNVLLRLAPGIDAHTHEFIMTGQEDSKFGFDVKSGQAERALKLVLDNPHFCLKGLHCHIGSQIFNTEGFHAATEKMIDLMVEWEQHYQFTAEVLNLGGGFGVHYTEEDEPLEAAEYVRQIAQIVKKSCQMHRYPLPEVWIEPGRSIVAEAGTTLYSVGAVKEIPSIRKYVSVDGGMGDNIRTALYDAKYQAKVANRMRDKQELEEVAITGKYCESGDMLIHSIQLPKLHYGDLIALQTTGAYGYSMSSNYNRNPRPAVVFVEDGAAQVVVQRETLEDLIHLDLPLK